MIEKETTIKKATTKPQSTYDLLIQDPVQKALLDAEYKELLISEMALAAQAGNEHSVGELAKVIKKLDRDLNTA